MSLKAMKTIQPKDYDMDVIQRNTKEFVQQLENNIILSGVLLKDITLTSASSTIIDHKLGREYQGYIITKLNANSVVYETTSTYPSKHLTLNCSANCTVSIYIF